jgi:eukaryotic-like serine/threonine-protein kinase
VTLPAGTKLGPYEILSQLGAGGMGEVYKARHSKLNREVAVKILPADTATDPAAQVRFEREARAVAALSHQNILAIHDFGTLDGIHYAVMELLSGETLRQRIDHGALPMRRAVEIAREIALGLAAAHDRGIIHRDLKPENLFLTKDGSVKILDFGLAREVTRPPTVDPKTLTDPSRSGVVVGTAGYMSPEQIRGQRPDARSDIFTFGSVLYEMLTGKRAFRGGTPADTMTAILRQEPSPFSETGRTIPPALERIVAHCLEKEPGDRFQSARDLAFDLGSITTVTSASGASTPILPESRWRRHAAFAAAALGLLALGAWAGVRFGPERRGVFAPTSHRLTFRRGNMLTARFAPDGKTVVYAAEWEGRPAELFSVRTDAIESHPLGLAHADLASISSKGDLAILLKTKGPRSRGTLARIPLGGGAPREILEDVSAASWAPNGEDLAAIRRVEDGRYRLEYPIGHGLYDSAFLAGPVAVSPDGEYVAFMEPEGNDRWTRLLVVDRKGGRRQLLRLENRIGGLAWSAGSREILFIGGRSAEAQGLRGVDLSGHERVLLPALGVGVRLHDVASDGRFLLERSSWRLGVECRPGGEAKEREVSWLDGSSLRGLSSDGHTFVFTEVGDGDRGSEGGVYLRRCGDAPAVQLGEGVPRDLSPDGKWALVLSGSPNGITLLPSGAGSSKRIAVPGIEPDDATFTPDGRNLVIEHGDEKGNALLSIVKLEDGQRRASPIRIGHAHGYAISPDGSQLAYASATDRLVVAPVESGGTSAKELPGPPLGEDEDIAQWSADGRFLFLSWTGGLPAKVIRREIATGESSPWLELQPSDTAGVTQIDDIRISPDGRSYAYGYQRREGSDLFVLDGIK